MDLDHLILGQLENIHDALERVAKNTADEPGGDFRVLSWDPAAPAGGAPAMAEETFRGRYKSVGVFNLSAGPITVMLTPAAAAQPHQITLSARGFIVLPVTGTNVSVTGAAAGDALVVVSTNPQPMNAGTF